MASNVELSVEPRLPFIDDPKYDVHTERPRTPNIPYSNYLDKQIKNIKQSRDTFFHFYPPDKYFDYNKHKRRSADFNVTPNCSNRNNVSRAGAYFHWGVAPAPGDSVCQHFHCESREKFTEIDLYRRPPTARPSAVVMKFGRPHTDYYGPRNPSSTSWFRSDCPLQRCTDRALSGPRTFGEYAAAKHKDKREIRNEMERFPNISEYIDRYALETRIPSSWVKQKTVFNEA